MKLIKELLISFFEAVKMAKEERAKKFKNSI